MQVGIVGYGRFGRALGGLLEECGHSFRALDPAAAIPSDNRAVDLQDLLAESRFLALAVPVPMLRRVLEAVVPFLREEHVVFDVSSVKAGPCRWMEEVLGPSMPFVGTHPLFGPVSLSRAEPLRVVLCPSPMHAQAASAVRSLFESLGCDVLEQNAEDHDRVMATTHALTFFLAKGLLDVGAGAELPFAPPSFHAIQHTLESVREDAGHLFATLQNQNPYAAGARARLLESMESIHRDLAEAVEEGEAALHLAIPDLGSRSPQLQEVRDVIDSLDHELLDLLARRMELARRAARAKAELGSPVLDPTREARLLADRRSWAEDKGIDAQGVEDVFRAVLRLSRRTQGG
jgi:prephenate dehydrogenase